MNETHTVPKPRRYFLLVAALFAVVLLFLLFLVLRGNEPSYQGKSLTQWIRGLEYENENPSTEQRTALRAMGEPAVTRLIELLEFQDSLLKRKFILYARKHTDIHNRFVATRMVVPQNIYHIEAATALGEIGPPARAAIPALLAACTNKYSIVGNRAQAALINIRQEPINPLLAALADPRSTNYYRAAETLKYLGVNAAAAVPLLVKDLGDTNVMVRESVVDALGGIASMPDITIPALIECLKTEPDAGIRRSAIDALRKFPGNKPQIVPVLLGFVRERDNNVWLGAAFGLEDLLTAEEKKTLLAPALLPALNSPVEVIRLNAATFLKRIDPAAAAKAGVK